MPVKKVDISGTMENQHVAAHLVKTNAAVIAPIAMENSHAHVAAIAVIVMGCLKVIVANK
jgi:hypothetical protein